MVPSITCAASVSLRSVESLRLALLDGFSQDSAIEVDASAVTDADLSFIQLIEAARVHAKHQNLSFRLNSPANAVVTALLTRAGFLTEPNADDIDFWFHGDRAQ